MCPFQDSQQRSHWVEQAHHQAVLENLTRSFSNVPVCPQRGVFGAQWLPTPCLPDEQRRLKMGTVSEFQMTNPEGKHRGQSSAGRSGLLLKKGTLSQLSLTCPFKGCGYFYLMFTGELSPSHSVYSTEGCRRFVYAVLSNAGHAIDWP